MLQREQKEPEEDVKCACRICHSAEETREDLLVAPCRCDGSLKYVHNSCQQAWLRARPGRLDYSCELCRAKLAYRLTCAVRLEIAAVCSTSAIVWFVQAASAVRAMRLGVWLLVAARQVPAGGGRMAGTPLLPGVVLLKTAAKMLASSAIFATDWDQLAHEAVIYFATAMGTLVISFVMLFLLNRPLTLLLEASLLRLCVIKIGGCVLVLLQEAVWSIPASQRPTPLPAWRVIVATLVLDTVLLAFLRVPKEERTSRGILLRIGRAACRLTGDFLPFAAIVFLWSASVVMIVVASLVPCMVLLVHEAALDVKRRQHRHGSLQLVVLLLRLIARLAIAAASLSAQSSSRWSWCENAAVVIWLAIEATILLDLWFLQCGVSCARNPTSQVMWTIALLGQGVLTVSGQLSGVADKPAQSTSFTGGALGGCGGSGLLLQGLVLHSGSGPSAPSAFARSRRTLGSIGGRSGGVAFLQDAALLVCFACYLRIHTPVFAGWARRVKQAFHQLFSQIEPAQVVFYDHVCHRP